MTNKATEMSFIQRRWKFPKTSDLHVTSVQTSFSKQSLSHPDQSFLIKLVSGQHDDKRTCQGKELPHFQFFFHNNKLSHHFLLTRVPVGTILCEFHLCTSAFCPKRSVACRAMLESKMSLNPGFYCTFTSVFDTRRTGGFTQCLQISQLF